jgi:hypothetical protein
LVDQLREAAVALPHGSKLALMFARYDSHLARACFLAREAVAG